MSVFILEHVTKSFTSSKKKRVILDDINMTLPDHGLVSIVGRSGCGKSTFLNILMGIEKPDKGKIYFQKKNIAKFNDRKFSNYHLTGVSLIFQHFNLFNNLTALENAILPLLMKGEKRKYAIKKATKLFQKLGIDFLINQKVSKLSGGEKQRVAIIRSLLTNPAAILCDEPTGALDYKNSVEIMEILHEISQKTLVIMVSHNKELVFRYSDKILELKEGKILVQLDNIKSTFSNPYQKNENKYNGKWKGKFLRSNLKTNFGKNIFSIIACSFSFSAIMISIGFILGSKNSQNEAINNNLSINYSVVSKTEFFELEGSPLSYQKTVRPDLDLIDEKFADFKSLKIEENLSYFVSQFSTCYFNDNQIKSYEMDPLYEGTLETFSNSMLIEGSNIGENFDEILINETFANGLGLSNIIGKDLIISNNAPINYFTGDSEHPYIRDDFSYTKKFVIKGIVKEFSFLNSPKIFYSYNGAKKFLKSEKMFNLSNYKNERISYYDFLRNSDPDDEVNSYSYFLFITDRNELEKFHKRINNLKTENDIIQVTSNALEIKDTYTTFIDSFSSTLFVFVIIAFLGVNFILGMISLSTFIQNRKNTAILTCLGSKNSSVYTLYLSENFLIIFISFLSSNLLSYFIQQKANIFILESYGLNNLISIPFYEFLNIPFGLQIILFFIFILFSTIFTIVPMVIYRKGSIVEELRDE